MEHQFALDRAGRWVNAKQTPYSDDGEYRCDCPDRHRLKLVKPSGRPGKRPFEDYFAHVGLDPRESCAGGVCRGGGESAVHRRAKQALRESAGRYDFVVWRCQRCPAEGVADSAGAEVGIEVRSEDGRWRYDCLMRRPCGVPVALEVFHTHATGVAKCEAVRALGLEMAEFDAADAMRRARTHARTHASTYTSTRTHSHKHTHTSTQAHAHTSAFACAHAHTSRDARDARHVTHTPRDARHVAHTPRDVFVAP